MTAATGNPTAAAQIVTFLNAGNTFYQAVQALRANPTQATFTAAAMALQALITASQAPAVQAAFATGWTAVTAAYTGLRGYFGI
jgi:hypothetical protein